MGEGKDGEGFAFFRWMHLVGACPEDVHSWQCMGCVAEWLRVQCGL